MRLWTASGFAELCSGVVRNFSFDKLRQKHERFLPTEIACLDRDLLGYAFLRDVQLGSAEYLLERDGRLHFARKIRIVKTVRVSNTLVRHELKKLPTESVTLARSEIREGHLVGSADSGVYVVNLAREAVWGKPLDHGVRIKKRAVNSFGLGLEDPMQSDSAN